MNIIFPETILERVYLKLEKKKDLGLWISSSLKCEKQSRAAIGKASSVLRQSQLSFQHLTNQSNKSKNIRHTSEFILNIVYRPGRLLTITEILYTWSEFKEEPLNLQLDYELRAMLRAEFTLRRGEAVAPGPPHLGAHKDFAADF